jgi:hypothetical protein
MFADDISINQWVAGGIVAIIVALWGAVFAIGKLLLAAKDSQVAEIKEQRDSYRKAAQRTADNLTAISDRDKIAKGEVPLPKVAPIVPEKNSPTTPRQQFSAEYQTLLAQITAAELALGIKRPEKPVQ